MSFTEASKEHAIAQKTVVEKYYTYVGGCSTDAVGKNLANWYERNTKLCVGYKNYTCIAVYKYNKLSGAIFYVNKTNTNIDVHVHLPNCLNRKTIKEMFNYPFNELKVKRLTAKVNSDNKKVIKILEGLGFKLEALLENYIDKNIDRLIFVVERQNINKWMT